MFQVQSRRSGTPQAQWRPRNREIYETSEAAQAWIDARPPQDESDPRAPWEYHITEVPD